MCPHPLRTKGILRGLFALDRPSCPGRGLKCVYRGEGGVKGSPSGRSGVVQRKKREQWEQTDGKEDALLHADEQTDG